MVQVRSQFFVNRKFRESVLLLSILVLLITLLSLYVWRYTNPSGVIRDIIWMPQRELLVLAGSRNVYTSTDYGDKWHTSEMLVSELTFSPSGQIGVQFSGISPHGPLNRPGYLAYSMDGQTWERTEVSHAPLRPTHFLSQPGEPLVFLSFARKIWSVGEGQEVSPPESWDLLADIESICLWGCRSGLVVDNATYVGAKWGIYLLREDQQEIYLDIDGSVYTFLRQDETCWAASTGRGAEAAGVYNVRCGRNDWQLVSTLPEFAVIIDMTYHNGYVYVAGQGVGWTSLIAKIDPAGGEYVSTDITGHTQAQALAIQPDGQGTLWVGTSHGLYKNNGAEWERVMLR